MSNIPIVVAEDETVIRKYTVSKVDYRSLTHTMKGAPAKKTKKHNTEGTLHVTNRRLIYNVDTLGGDIFNGRCKDLNSQQLRIEDVQGVDFMTSRSRPAILLPILLIVFGLITAMFMIGIPILIIGAILLIIRLRKRESMMMIGIKSQASDYGMFISEMSREYYGSIQYWCAPTEEFETMSRELGAIVLDLQKYGDQCIEKWINAPRSASGNE